MTIWVKDIAGGIKRLDVILEECLEQLALSQLDTSVEFSEILFRCFRWRGRGRDIRLGG